MHDVYIHTCTCIYFQVPVGRNKKEHASLWFQELAGTEPLDLLINKKKVYTCTYTYMCICVSTCTCIYMYMYMYIHVHVDTHIHMYVYVHVYTFFLLINRSRGSVPASS